VELFEDGDRNRKAVFNLREKKKGELKIILSWQARPSPRNLINKLLTIG